MNHLKNVHYYLNKPHTARERTVMRYLLEKIAYLKELNLLWQKHMDVALQAYTQILDYQHPILYVAVKNSVFCTQLRYRSPLILKKLKTIFGMEMLEEIQYLIRPEFFQEKETPISHEKPHLTQEHAEMILLTAESITHLPLREALHRLGSIFTAKERIKI